MYCELCLLYYIFCAILYSVNVAIELFLSPVLCVVYYVAILCVSRIIQFCTVLYGFRILPIQEVV